MRADEIKAAVPLDRLLQFYSFSPNRAGYISCPFHSGDKTPSLRIYADQNSWHCFGCQRGGSVIDFAMQSEALDFRAAIAWLAETFGIEQVERTPVERKRQAMRRHRLKQEQARRNRARQDLREEITALNIEADYLRDRIRAAEYPEEEDIAIDRARYALVDYQRKGLWDELDRI